MLYVNRFFMLAILVVLASCATTGGQEISLEQKLADKGYKLGEPVERILQWRLDSWVYLDRGHVIMQTEPSTWYLVSLKNSCQGLGQAENIAFTTTTSQLTRFDKLVVRGAGKIREDCYIDTLHKLEKVKKN